jgi:Cytosol aminopeptidase family, catalytic domain
MGLYLAVGRGSTANEPHFIHLTYSPSGALVYCTDIRMQVRPHSTCTQRCEVPPNAPFAVIAVSHKVTREVALVGKTVTFDTGGYNLKVCLKRIIRAPSTLTGGTIRVGEHSQLMCELQVEGGIEYMKMDMCGGAAVLGAAEAISQIRPEGVEASLLEDTFAPDSMALTPSSHLIRRCR